MISFFAFQPFFCDVAAVVKLWKLGHYAGEMHQQHEMKFQFAAQNIHFHEKISEKNHTNISWSLYILTSILFFFKSMSFVTIFL